MSEPHRRSMRWNTHAPPDKGPKTLPASCSDLFGNMVLSVNAESVGWHSQWHLLWQVQRHAQSGHGTVRPALRRRPSFPQKMRKQSRAAVRVCNFAVQSFIFHVCSLSNSIKFGGPTAQFCLTFEIGILLSITLSIRCR